jgi:hypothetical protein
MTRKAPKALSAGNGNGSLALPAPEPVTVARPVFTSTMIPAEEKWPQGGWLHYGRHPYRAKTKILSRREGRITVTPRRTKVALVGFASSTRMMAPYDDPTWEIWGMNQLYRYLPRFDRWFEIHHRAQFLADTVRDTDYISWLREAKVPIYMNPEESPYPDIPYGVRFPIERTQALSPSGRDYFTSTIAFMISLAVLEGFEEIGLWGIDLIVNEEYVNQKPCAEWWLGFAEARGVKIHLPQESALLKQWHRYGAPEPDLGIRSWWLTKRLMAYQKNREDYITQLNQVDGATEEIKALVTAINDHVITTTGQLNQWLQARLQGYANRHEQGLIALNNLDGIVEELSALVQMADNHERGLALQPPVPS